MVPYYGWGSTASRLEPLQGGSLLFTNKSPEIPGTHFIDLGRMKGRVNWESSALTTRPLHNPQNIPCPSIKTNLQVPACGH